MTDLSTICFDLDGTLCVHEQSLPDLLDRAFSGVGVDPFCTAETLSAIDQSELPTAESDIEFFENLFRAGAERAGNDPERVRQVAEAYDDLVDHTAVSFRAGAEEALAYTRERYDLALVTNGGADTQRVKLQSLGIENAFETCVFCDPANGIEPKPDPTALRIVLDDLGVDPGETLIVGDSLGTDIAAANRIGMRSVWVPRTDPPEFTDHEPTHTLDSLSELSRIL